MIFFRKIISTFLLSLFSIFPFSFVQKNLPFLQSVSPYLSRVPYNLSQKPKIIRLHKTDPYEMGLEHGKKLRKEIHDLYPSLIHKMQKKFHITDQELYSKAKKFEALIPSEYIQEMKGIAQGAKIEYEQILIGNTILDMIHFGCSVLAVQETDSLPSNHLVATNHFISQPSKKAPSDSLQRYFLLDNKNASCNLQKQIQNLQKTNVQETVQSILFDPAHISIVLSTKPCYAARGPFWHYSSKQLFDENIVPVLSIKTSLARNLDWPIEELGPSTIIISRPATKTNYSIAVVSWPGYIGALSGINSEGLCLATSVSLSSQQEAIPNALIFRELLERADSSSKALEILKERACASSMNLMLADKEHITRIEIDPKRSKRGYVHIDFF